MFLQPYSIDSGFPKNHHQIHQLDIVFGFVKLRSLLGLKSLLPFTTTLFNLSTRGQTRRRPRPAGACYPSLPSNWNNSIAITLNEEMPSEAVITSQFKQFRNKPKKMLGPQWDSTPWPLRYRWPQCSTSWVMKTSIHAEISWSFFQR